MISSRYIQFLLVPVLCHFSLSAMDKSLYQTICERIATDQPFQQKSAFNAQASGLPDTVHQTIAYYYCMQHKNEAWQKLATKTELKGHTRNILAAQFVDEQYLFTADAGGTLCLWDIKSQPSMHEIKTLSKNTESQSMSETQFDSEIDLIEWDSPVPPIQIVTQDPQTVNQCAQAVIQDEAHEMSASRSNGACSEAENDALALKSTDQLKQDYHLKRYLQAHDKNIYALIISYDKSFFITASEDQTVKIWKIADFTSGECDATSINPMFVINFDSPVRCLALSENGTLVVALKNGLIRIFQVDHTQLPFNCNHIKDITTYYNPVSMVPIISSLSISSDGSQLICGRSGKADIWDLRHCLGTDDTASCVKLVDNNDDFSFVYAQNNWVLYESLLRSRGHLLEVDREAFKNRADELDDVVTSEKCIKRKRSIDLRCGLRSAVFADTFLLCGLMQDAAMNAKAALYEIVSDGSKPEVRLVRSFCDFSLYVSVCAFSPEGTSLIVGDGNGKLEFYTINDLCKSMRNLMHAQLLFSLLDQLDNVLNQIDKQEIQNVIIRLHQLPLDATRTIILQTSDMETLYDDLPSIVKQELEKHYKVLKSSVQNVPSL